MFSRISWQKLSPEDQALIKKLSKEAQAEQRVLWYEAENAAIDNMKAAGTEIITDIDKKRSRKPSNRSGTSTARSTRPWSSASRRSTRTLSRRGVAGRCSAPATSPTAEAI